jgi:hypothetical protein
MRILADPLVLALPKVELEQVGTGHHVEGGGLTAVLQPHQGQAPSAADPGQQPDQLKKKQPVLRIHDILVWIRIWIRGSLPLTNGSGCGSRSFYFHH